MIAVNLLTYICALDEEFIYIQCMTFLRVGESIRIGQYKDGSFLCHLDAIFTFRL